MHTGSTTRLRRLHRASAAMLIAFAGLHLANHLAALAGADAHLAFMDIARAVYRHPLVEPLLIGGVLWQAASGAVLLQRGRGRLPRWQVLSGACLGYFLIAHVGSVLLARSVLALDTNLHFAAASLQVPPWPVFFAPYYLLAVVALFVHVGCAWSRRLARPARAAVPAWAALAGAGVALPIIVALAGGFHPVEVPADYREPLVAVARLLADGRSP